MPALPRSQLLLYAALALVVGVLGLRALRAERPPAGGPPEAVVEGAGTAPAAGLPPVEGPAEPGDRAGEVREPIAQAGASSAAGGTGRDLVVHVAGAVRRPGVYRMAAGARVQDAVTQAGGPGRGAEVHRLNLAARVTDGQQILIPRRGRRTGAPTAGGSSPARPPGAHDTAGAPDTAAAPETAGAASGGAPLGPEALVDLNTATIAELETLDGVGPAIAQKIVDWREANGGFRTVDDLAQVSGIGPKKLEAMRPRVRV